MAAPRDAHTRKADTLAKLRARHADIWVASASIDDAQPVAHLIPLSLAWIDECVVVAAPARQQTTRNIAEHGKARLALLVVLETLGPAERLAFVLHDMFAVPFEEIASILGRSPAAAKQLASRARRRVQGAAPDDDIETDVTRQRAVVDAFLAASRGGDFDALVALLDPNVVLRADSTVVKRPRANLQPEVRGALAVADAFAGRAAGAQTAMIDGFVGAVWVQGGRPRAVFEFRIAHGKIVSIEVVGDPERLGELELEVLS